MLLDRIILASVFGIHMLLGLPTQDPDPAAEPGIRDHGASSSATTKPMLECGQLFVEVPTVIPAIEWDRDSVASPMAQLNDDESSESVTPNENPVPNGTPIESEEPAGVPIAGIDTTPAPSPGNLAQRLVESCEGQLAAWQSGDVPDDRYWRPWNDEPSPWCSEFVGWNLQNIGLVEGETMPPDPSYAAAYYSFYSEHPELAEIHENDGSYVPRDGDIVLFSEFAHTEMVTHVDADGQGWEGISGGGSVDGVHRSLSDGACWQFITLLG